MTETDPLRAAILHSHVESTYGVGPGTATANMVCPECGAKWGVAIHLPAYALASYLTGVSCPNRCVSYTLRLEREEHPDACAHGNWTETTSRQCDDCGETLAAFSAEDL